MEDWKIGDVSLCRPHQKLAKEEERRGQAGNYNERSRHIRLFQEVWLGKTLCVENDAGIRPINLFKRRLCSRSPGMRSSQVRYESFQLCLAKKNHLECWYIHYWDPGKSTSVPCWLRHARAIGSCAMLEHIRISKFLLAIKKVTQYRTVLLKKAPVVSTVSMKENQVLNIRFGPLIHRNITEHWAHWYTLVFFYLIVKIRSRIEI